MRFANEMRKTAYELETEKGWNVLQCVYSPEEAVPSEEELLRLREAHFRKIDLSDGIYVVNPGGYIGEAVRKEIAYAREKGKEVRYHCP